VRLPPKDYMVLVKEKDTLYAMGIEIDEFGKDTLIVRSLPEALKGADINGILSDVASTVLEKTHPLKSLEEAIAARIACHSSVRGRTILRQEELQRLVSELEKAEYPGQCPHGRPTKLNISLNDLKKVFKRK
jgi:DNA mismatch repair protein MutL